MLPRCCCLSIPWLWNHRGVWWKVVGLRLWFRGRQVDTSFGHACCTFLEAEAKCRGRLADMTSGLWRCSQAKLTLFILYSGLPCPRKKEWYGDRKMYVHQAGQRKYWSPLLGTKPRRHSYPSSLTHTLHDPVSANTTLALFFRFITKGTAGHLGYHLYSDVSRARMYRKIQNLPLSLPCLFGYK